MLRSNCKTVKTAVQQYIIDGFNNHCCNYELAENSDFVEVAKQIKSIFYDEKIRHDKRNLIEYELFEEWCRGLSGIIDTTYYIKPCKDLLGDWLQETQAEKDRFSESDAESMITRLLYRELSSVWG